MEIRFKTTSALLFGILLIPCLLQGQNSEPVRDQFVEATLIGEREHIQPGSPYRVGLLLKHDPRWHTYWKSTATGYATSIDWSLPEGFTVSDISWPTPKVYDFQGWIEYVYDGQVLLMATLTPPEQLPEGFVEIGFKAEWLMCEDVCVPGSVASSIKIPVNDSIPGPSATWAPLFQESDRLLPADPEAYGLQAWRSGNGVTLEIRGALPDSITFFDDQALFKAEASASLFAVSDNTVRINLALDEAADSFPERLTGVLKADPGWPDAEGRPGLLVNVPISATAPASADAPAGITLGILALAFVGGLILNLMPCVFPVLGIKIMGFVGQAGAARGKIVAHGLVFTSGVLLSFWTLAAVLLVLRSGGSQLGWGFQLQSPGFVLALTLLLFAFALNMSGLFEVGQSAVGVGSGLTRKSGFSGSFFSGVLATVVATPCAAPFLAPALGAALALPAAASFLIFTLIALGLSAPYLILSAMPGLVNHLPRPGAWMETFKQFMSFLLYATVGYLIWVLAGQLTEAGGYPVFSLLKVLLSLVVVAFALWIYGRWGAFHRTRRTRAIAIAASVLVLVGGISLAVSGTRTDSGEAGTVNWEKWAPGKAEALAREGKIVYVDFTARWCVTCQTNKAAVFSSQKVRDRFAELEVVTLKADWTNQDPEISQALASFGRSAVPFNLVYGPHSDEPRLLPEILTPGIVLEAVEAASGPR
jgi:thiol:disulfide interchange protein DsbD